MNSADAPKSSSTNVENDLLKTNKHRDWHGATVGIIIGLLGLIAGRLGYLWIGFDVFSQFSLQFILLSIASAIGIVMPRYKGLVAAILFAGFVSLYSAWPHIVSAGPVKLQAISAGTKPLKVASFNTFVLNQNYADLTASILKMDADFVVLIEFDSYKSSMLASLKSIYPFQFECTQASNCEMAILSKYPVTDGQAKGIWEGPGYISAKLGPEFGGVTIFGVHTTRFPHSRAQFTQINAMVKVVEAVPGRVIVMGDFNATPFSRINQTMATGAGLTRLTSLPTWPATHGLPQLAIDHIFVSHDITALSDERIGDNAGSDHFPVTMVLGVPNK